MARQKDPDDKDWSEVEQINSYALFMGYLSMGVRGLGLLVLTWTTVVLLGGFVSMLQKKDFWCLTAITLVQTAGVFDFLLKEKASDIGNSLKGLILSLMVAVLTPFKTHVKTSMNSSKNILEVKDSLTPRVVLLVVLSVVQVSMIFIVLCPLAVLYVLGLYLSTGISLWRLIQHDYGNPDEGANNLKPALNVLYSLAVGQGVVYVYRSIYDLVVRTAVVEVVATDYSTETYVDETMDKYYSLETDLVSEYLDETVARCMKDPSFARGRNLVTYGVELLMESKSRYDYVSGILILRTLTLKGEQSAHLKQILTGSASSSHVVQRLVETFGPTSPYSTEIRFGAARIVAAVAGSIRLDQLPQGMMIECISSLLDTFEEYSWRPEGSDRSRLLDLDIPKEYEREWLTEEPYLFFSLDEIPRATEESDSRNLLQGYKDLVAQGLRILQKLAVNKNNCRVISNTEGLLCKAMAHITSDKLHTDHHDEWSIIAKEFLEFVYRLLATLGGGTETTKLTSEISSSSSQAIMRTLGCHKCHMNLKGEAAQVLLHLSLDTPPSIVPGASGSESSSISIIFVWILLDIFLVPVRRRQGATHLVKYSSYTTRLAGEKMQAMIHPKKEASLQSVVGDVIGSLARTVAGAENNAHRIHAARVLGHLYQKYRKDDENLKQLREAVASVMEEVLQEIVHWLTTEEKQVVTEANNGGKVLLIEGPDLEQGGVPLGNDNGEESSSTPYYQRKGEQHQGIQLQEALIELCWVVYAKLTIGEDHNLARRFDEMAAKICSGQGMPDKTFEQLVVEAQGKIREEKEKASRLAANSSSTETET